MFDLEGSQYFQHSSPEHPKRSVLSNCCQRNSLMKCSHLLTGWPGFLLPCGVQCETYEEHRPWSFRTIWSAHASFLLRCCSTQSAKLYFQAIAACIPLVRRIQTTSPLTHSLAHQLPKAHGRSTFCLHPCWCQPSQLFPTSSDDLS